MDSAGSQKLVVIDFFMPDCYYCKKFKNDWNKIVEEFTTEYGADQIEFVKVDGTADTRSANRYSVESFPTFIAIEPGSFGERWDEWDPQHRDFAGMKRWLTRQLNKHDLKPLAETTGVSAVEKLQQNYHLGSELPVAENQPSGAQFKMQMDENKRMQALIQSMLTS